MSLIEQIDLSAAFLERIGRGPSAILLDATAARLAALEGENPEAPQLQPEHQEFAAPVEADHLAPGTILMLQETGETLSVVEFDGEAYLLSNGERITDGELDQLSADGLISVLSPEAEEAMDQGMGLADAMGEGGEPMPMMAEAVARMIHADLTGEIPREAADFFDQNVEAPVLTLPDPPTRALPGKLGTIVKEEISRWEERTGQKVHPEVMRGPDEDGWVLALHQPGDILCNAILQRCSNEGLEAHLLAWHEGWRSIAFDEFTDEGDGAHSVPAMEVEPDGDELKVAGTVFRAALYRQVHRGYTIRQHQNGTWGIYAMPPKMDFDGSLQCTALNLEDAKKKIDAWMVDSPREAGSVRTADDFPPHPHPQPRQEPHQPEPPVIPVEKEDGSQVYIRRPDGAVYHLPMVVVQRALEMGYGQDLRKLFAGVTQVEVRVGELPKFLPKEKTCPTCKGTGKIKPAAKSLFVTCPTCKGAGKVLAAAEPITAADHWIVPNHYRAGAVCSGSGKEAPEQSLTPLNGGMMGKCAACNQALKLTKRTAAANPSLPAAQPAPQAGAARREASAKPFAINPTGTPVAPFMERLATSDPSAPAPDFQGGAPEWPGGLADKLYGDSAFEFDRFATQAMITHAVRSGRVLTPREFYGNRWAAPFKDAPVAEIRKAFMSKLSELGFRAVYDDPPRHDDDGEWTATMMHAKAGGISLRVRRRGGSMQVLTNDEAVGSALTNVFGKLFEYEDPPPPPPRHERGVISMLCKSRDEIYLRDVGVAGVELERDNYEAEVISGYDHVCADMATATPCGRLALFDGTPGCGKTYMLRAMLKNVKTAGFIIVPPTMVEALGDPSIIPALVDGAWRMPNHRMVFLVEDADEALVTRDKAIEQHRSNVKALSSLLNMSDGIPGAMFDVRIVASTNAVLESIDPAILRDGRLCKRIEVKALSPEKANQVFKRLLPTLANAGAHVNASPFDKPTPLATVYKKARELGWAPPVPVTASVLPREEEPANPKVPAARQASTGAARRVITVLAGDFPKTCPKCGKVYSKEAWDALPLRGIQKVEPGYSLELKNCTCRTTLAIEVHSLRSGVGELDPIVASVLLTAIIKKCGDKWCLYSHEGKILGHHDSYESALAQERAIKSHGG